MRIFQNNYHSNGVMFYLAIEKYAPTIGYLICNLEFDNIHYLRNRTYVVNGSMYLRSLFVEPMYRGEGNGTKLLQHGIQFAHNVGIRDITLDDMSDRYRCKDNIYLKNGFKYVGDGCEMRYK